MTTPSLFIGLVSHAKTKYQDSLTDQGLAQQLASTLPGAEVFINARNLADDQGIAISRKAVQDSLTAQMRVNRQWAFFLGNRPSPTWWFLHSCRQLFRLFRVIFPPHPRTVRRLLNIELSHRFLLEQGLESKAPWLLILEDDAECSDIHALCRDLEFLIHNIPEDGFINLSDSFSFEKLGITHLLSPDSQIQWTLSEGRKLLRCQVPATNTVCAILYSRQAAHFVLRALEEQPLTPVLPIDWKLNAVFMRKSRLATGVPFAAWFVDPAPIRQRSMGPTEIMTK